MLITNVQRFSTNDGPGIRTAVFMKGCPLRCTWCHNPETWSPHQEFYFLKNKCIRCGHCADICPENVISYSLQDSKLPKRERDKCTKCMKCVDGCPSGALELVGREWTIDEVMKEVEADRLFYDNSQGGLTITGGEALLWPKITCALLERAKKEKIHTCIDTSGYARWEDFEIVLPYTDMVLYDLKCMELKKHIDATGVSNEIIIQNLKKIHEKFGRKIKVRLRLPIIPGFNNKETFLYQVGKLAVELDDTVDGIDILPFHNWAEGKYEQLDKPYDFARVASMLSDELMPFVKILKNLNLEVTVGG